MKSMQPKKKRAPEAHASEARLSNNAEQKLIITRYRSAACANYHVLVRTAKSNGD